MLGGALHDSQVFDLMILWLAESLRKSPGTYIRDRMINFVNFDEVKAARAAALKSGQPKRVKSAFKSQTSRPTYIATYQSKVFHCDPKLA